MIIIYYIIFGLAFIVFDWILGKLIKKEDPIFNFIEDSILKLTGDSTIVYMLVLVGGLVGSALLANTFADDSIGFWVFTTVAVIFTGFIGKAWIKN